MVLGFCGRQHLYRLLGASADKSEIATVENINRSIAHALGGHIGSVDAVRILRCTQNPQLQI